MGDPLEQYRYRMIADLEPGLNIYILDQEFRYKFFNKVHQQGMQEAFDVSINLGDVKTELLPSPYKEKYSSLYKRAFEGEQYRYVQKFEESFIEFLFFPFKTEEGEEEVLIKAQDITEEVRLNLELERYRENLEEDVAKRTSEVNEQRTFFQTAINEDPNLIFVRDVEGKYIFANQALADAKNLSVDEMIGKSIFEVHHDDGSPEQFLKEDQEVILKGASFHYINEFVKSSGEKYWLSVIKKKVRLNLKDYVLGVMTDITDLVNTRNELEEVNSNLNTTLQEFKETQLRLITSEKIASILLLTSGFMHEINNPINYVSGNVEPLRRDIEDLYNWLDKSEIFENNKKERESYELTKDEIDVLLSGIEEGTSRVKDLVKNLRNLATTGEDEKSMCEIHEIIHTILTMLNLIIEKKQIRVETDFDSAVDQIYCNPNHLHQIFINILDYVISRMEKGEVLKLISSVKGNSIMVQVIDESRGITQQEILRMIDPFDKISPNSKMGLAVSYRIASKIDGAIELSETDKATHFHVKIPYPLNT
jgi:PAS domain S-box-containing protein